MGEIFRKVKESSDKDAGQLFLTKILPMLASQHEPVSYANTNFMQIPPSLPRLVHRDFPGTFGLAC